MAASVPCLPDNARVTERTDLRTACRAFVAAAFGSLEREHVIPTPVYHPYVAVGRDYPGHIIMGLAEYQALEAKLGAAYTERLGGRFARSSAELASTYMFSLLEACVARCAREGSYAALGAAVETSISELLEVLEKSAYEVVCCRHVSHLTTASGQEIQVGDVTVVPETDGIIGLTGRIQQEINGAARAWNREDQTVFDPPHSLLIIRETAQEAPPFQVGGRLSGKLERFLFIARLLTAGTAQSTYEVSGTTTLVSRMSPRMRTFGKGMFDLLVRRTVRLSGDEGIAFATLGELIDAANVKREGMVATSFDVALSKFNLSHSGSSPFEHLVDLATALEAVLIGADKETQGHGKVVN
jgi:hypothetical protein